MRAFTALWDRVCTERYGVTDPKLRRMRYGVQVNSLGLTEAQPENNVPRIVLEALGVTLSKRARARALQLPAWNEALGLPRPWDQQWSLRIQQILAFESDLLEYGDIFDGSVVIEKKTAEVAEAVLGRAGGRAGPGRGLRGHRRAEVAPGRQPVRAGPPHRDRRAPGGRASTASPRRPSRRWPRRTARAASIMRVDPAVEAELTADVAAWRAARDGGGRAAGPRRPAAGGRGDRQRHAGHHRPGPRRRHHRRVGGRPAPGVRRVPGPDRGGRRRRPPGRRVRRPCWPGPGRWPTAPAGRPGCWWPSPASTATPTAPSRSRWPPGTPASRSSTRGSASPPREIAAAARDEDVDVVGISILSGSHLELVPEVVERLRADGRGRPGGGRGDHPARGRGRPAGQGRGPGLHAEGLRDRPDDGRPDRPGRAAPGAASAEPTGLTGVRPPARRTPRR